MKKLMFTVGSAVCVLVPLTVHAGSGTAPQYAQMMAAVPPLPPLAAAKARPAPAREPVEQAPRDTAELPSIDYRLGGGDTVRITVYQNPDLTLETRVGETGDMSYPLIGRVKIGGRTLDGAADVIAQELTKRNLVVHPQVTVTLLQVRGNQVSVLGQVSKPGRIPLETTGMRLSEVLAAAGGVVNAQNSLGADGSGADEVIITGVRDGQPFRRRVDLSTLLTGANEADDMTVANGDTVYVPPARIYYIYGEVQRPGAYRIKPGMTVRQALALAGGPTQRGTERGLHIERTGDEGKADEIRPQMNDLVRADDVVYVPESLF